MNYLIVESPIGSIVVTEQNQSIKHLYFQECINLDELNQCTGGLTYNSENILLAKAARQLTDYFQGGCQVFDIAVAPVGTEFQVSVWCELQKIQYGQTWTYAQLAERLEKPLACRAVGSANGKNPVSIIIPCHRVIGKSGKLTGYAGGVERKAWLLEHERRSMNLPVNESLF